MFGAEAAVKGRFDQKAARDNQAYAAQQQKAGLQLLNELDYEPEYASNHVPTYQRTDSPIARSYIESFLMGNNPDAISPVSPNAGARKVQAQAQQNAMFGTPDERMARQEAFQQATPWKVTAPTRPINPNASGYPGAALWTSTHGDLAGIGLNKNAADALNSGGVNLDAIQAKSAQKKGLRDTLEYSTTSKELEYIVKNFYNGDADKFAADVRDAGGLDQLIAQKQWKGGKVRA